MTIHTSPSSALAIEKLTTWSRRLRSQMSPPCRWRRRIRCRIGNVYKLSGFFTPDRKGCATPADP